MAVTNDINIQFTRLGFCLSEANIPIILHLRLANDQNRMRDVRFNTIPYS